MVKCPPINVICREIMLFLEAQGVSVLKLQGTEAIFFVTLAERYFLSPNNSQQVEKIHTICICIFIYMYKKKITYVILSLPQSTNVQPQPFAWRKFSPISHHPMGKNFFPTILLSHVSDYRAHGNLCCMGENVFRKTISIMQRQLDWVKFLSSENFRL